MKAETLNTGKTIFMRIAILDMDILARNWWVVLLRGAAGITFGLITLLAPDISLTALVLVFGASLSSNPIIQSFEPGEYW
ncbi:MAG TPA: hypothetical protein VFU31_20870, partial [Candidatus Binatia bacterium]|nr:hypothetical protein [Candidatus Binatia bacterium]